MTCAYGRSAATLAQNMPQWAFRSLVCLSEGGLSARNESELVSPSAALGLRLQLELGSTSSPECYLNTGV